MVKLLSLPAKPGFPAEGTPLKYYEYVRCCPMRFFLKMTLLNVRLDGAYLCNKHEHNVQAVSPTHIHSH